MEGPGKWSAPGPVLALGGPGDRDRVRVRVRVRVRHPMADLRYGGPESILALVLMLV